MLSSKPIANQGKFGREIAAILTNLYKMRVRPGHPRFAAINEAIDDAEALIFAHRNFTDWTPTFLLALNEKIDSIKEMRVGGSKTGKASLGNIQPLTDDVIWGAVRSTDAKPNPSYQTIGYSGLGPEERLTVENVFPVLSEMRSIVTQRIYHETPGLVIRTPDDFFAFFCPRGGREFSGMEQQQDLVPYRIITTYDIDDFDGVINYLRKSKNKSMKASVGMTPDSSPPEKRESGWIPCVCIYEEIPDEKAFANEDAKKGAEFLAFMLSKTEFPGRIIELGEGQHKDHCLYVFEDNRPRLLGKVLFFDFMNKPLELSEAYVELVKKYGPGEVLFEKVGFVEEVSTGGVVWEKTQGLCVYSSAGNSPELQRLLERTLGFEERIDRRRH